LAAGIDRLRLHVGLVAHVPEVPHGGGLKASDLSLELLMQHVHRPSLDSHGSLSHPSRSCGLSDVLGDVLQFQPRSSRLLELTLGQLVDLKSNVTDHRSLCLAVLLGLSLTQLAGVPVLGAGSL
jgi:hypothetical protein